MVGRSQKPSRTARLLGLSALGQATIGLSGTELAPRTLRIASSNSSRFDAGSNPDSSATWGLWFGTDEASREPSRTAHCRRRLRAVEGYPPRSNRTRIRPSGLDWSITGGSRLESSGPCLRHPLACIVPRGRRDWVQNQDLSLFAGFEFPVAADYRESKEALVALER